MFCGKSHGFVAFSYSLSVLVLFILKNLFQFLKKSLRYYSIYFPYLFFFFFFFNNSIVIMHQATYDFSVFNYMISWLSLLRAETL